MLSYDKSLKQISRNLRRNMIDKITLTPLCQRGEIEQYDPHTYAKNRNN
jgi:hypothetical protein